MVQYDYISSNVALVMVYKKCPLSNGGQNCAQLNQSKSHFSKKDFLMHSPFLLHACRIYAVLLH